MVQALRIEGLGFRVWSFFGGWGCQGFGVNMLMVLDFPVLVFCFT